MRNNMRSITITPKQHDVLFVLIQAPLMRRVKCSLSSGEFRWKATIAADDKTLICLDGLCSLGHPNSVVSAIEKKMDKAGAWR